MGVPLSLSTAELALFMGIVIVVLLVAAFVAVFLSAIIGVGVVQLVYVCGCWGVKKIRESYSSVGRQHGVTDRISGTVGSVADRHLRLQKTVYAPAPATRQHRR